MLGKPAVIVIAANFLIERQELVNADHAGVQALKTVLQADIVLGLARIAALGVAAIDVDPPIGERGPRTLGIGLGVPDQALILQIAAGLIPGVRDGHERGFPRPAGSWREAFDGGLLLLTPGLTCLRLPEALQDAAIGGVQRAIWERERRL